MEDLEPRDPTEVIWPDPNPDTEPESEPGAWVNDNSYNPGKRHYIPAGVTRLRLRSEERNGYRYDHFTDRPNGPALCSRSDRPYRASTGYVCFKDGRPSHRYGGLSVKEKVNLLQRNLCSYCLKRYIAERPNLKAAVEAIQKAEVMS